MKKSFVLIAGVVALLLLTLAPTTASAQTENCAGFQSEASNMPPEARHALRRLLVTCSSDIVGGQCKEAIRVFDFEYDDRFVAINRAVQAWSLLEQRAKIRKRLNKNSVDDPRLIDLRGCLEDVHVAGVAQSDPAKDAPFGGRRGEPATSHPAEFTYDPKDRLNNMYSRQMAALEKSEEHLREVTENLEAQLSALNQRTTEIGNRIWWILVLIVFCTVFLYFKRR